MNDKVTVSVLTIFFAIYFNFCVCEINCKPDTDTLSTTDWPLFLAKYCGRKCQNGTLITAPAMCTFPMCFPCDCNEHCSLKGTCCPASDTDYSEKFTEIVPSTENIYLNGIHNRIKCSSPTSSVKFYLTVAECPAIWQNEDIRQKCESPTRESLESLTPYSHRELGLSFTNRFCALCNGLDPFSVDKRGKDGTKGSLLPFTLEIKCEHYQNLFHITDEFEMYKAARSIEECSVSFFPKHDDMKKCNTEFTQHKDVMVSTCSSDANQTLVDLCHNLTDILALRVSQAKNLFCFLCSGMEFHNTWDSNSEGDLGGGRMGWRSPIYLLFRATSKHLKDGNAAKVMECQPYEWRNDEGECISAVCSEGKKIDNQGTCKSVIEDLGGLSYDLEITFLPKTELPKKLFEHIIETTDDVFGLKESSQHLVLGYTTKDKECNTTDHHSDHKTYCIKELIIKGVIKASDFIPRDEFESELLQLSRKISFNLTVFDDKKNIDLNVQFGIACIGKELCSIYHNISLNESNSETQPGKKLMPILPVSEAYSDMIWIDLGPRFNLFTWPSKRIDFTPSLICPVVALNLTKKPEVADSHDNILLGIELRGQEINITWNMNVSLVDNEVLVCVSLVQELVRTLEFEQTSSHIPDKDYNDIVLTVSYYLDIICITVSCLCLMASIVTYLIFPSLRCLPGLNNLCLCSSLLTAQVCLLVTTLLGTRGLLPKIYCLAHAIILHYSWVASFLWMNTCCIHMFRVFTAKSIGSNHGKFLYYCLYSFGCSLLVVTCTITITAVTTDNNSIGYDGDICFLDTGTSILIIILALLSPLGFTVLVNGVLFSLTIKEIISVTRLQEQPRSSHGVITYVKLSTVTGIFCLVSAGAVQFEVSILSLLSGPLAALQGLFIFLSFTANKRVGKMYKDLVSSRHLRAKNSTQSTDMMSNSESNSVKTKSSRVSSFTSEIRFNSVCESN